MSPACSSHSFMHIHKHAAVSGFPAQMQRVKSRRSSSLSFLRLLSALNQLHLMLRCLFEPYGKWEIFTYIIAGMKVTDVFSQERVSTSKYRYKNVFYPENNTSAPSAITLLQPRANHESQISLIFLPQNLTIPPACGAAYVFRSAVWE